MHKTLAFVFPLLVALLLTGFIPVQPPLVDDARLQLKRLSVSSVAELEKSFSDLGYQWPLSADATIPPVELTKLPLDLAQVRDVQQKKGLFFRVLLPIVLAENEKVLELRRHILGLLDKGVANLDESEQRWLKAVAGQHKVKGELGEPKAREMLLRRVDIVPPALVLAQAANESAWGTSRFARQGNNLFGQWTYRQSEGIVPLSRPDGATYAVRSFSSLDASVRAYIQNINTNSAYQKLRLLRQQMRNAGLPLDGHELATGLEAYSARGQEYIHELQAMMRSNKLLTMLESVSLGRGS
jgi:Bax protein